MAPEPRAGQDRASIDLGDTQIVRIGPYAEAMASNVEKPGTGVGTKVLIVIGLVVVAWVAFNLLGGVVRWIFSLFAYVVVAFVAFWLGRLTAKSDDDT